MGVWQQEARCWFLNAPFKEILSQTIWLISYESFDMSHDSWNSLAPYLPMKFISERRYRRISPLLSSIFWFSSLKRIFKVVHFKIISQKFQILEWKIFSYQIARWNPNYKHTNFPLVGAQEVVVPVVTF